MKYFSINYDLIKVKDYPRLRDHLQSIGGWSSGLESSWYVPNGMGWTASQMKDHLRLFIDEDDKIQVIQFDPAPENIADNLSDRPRYKLAEALSAGRYTPPAGALTALNQYASPNLTGLGTPSGLDSVHSAGALAKLATLLSGR